MKHKKPKQLCSETSLISAQEYLLSYNSGIIYIYRYINRNRFYLGKMQHLFFAFIAVCSEPWTSTK